MIVPPFIGLKSWEGLMMQSREMKPQEHITGISWRAAVTHRCTAGGCIAVRTMEVGGVPGANRRGAHSLAERR